MKQLTMNQVARASLRANRKAYISLAVGIFLAVYLAAVMSLGGWGTVQAQRRQIIDRVGEIDCFLLDAQSVITDEELRESGLFNRVGRVYVTAAIGDTGVYAGTMDEEAAALLHRHVTEGRMPQAAGEIAIERSALERMRLEAGVGDRVTWLMRAIDGEEEERSYTIVGILSEQTTSLDVTGNSWASQRELHWPAALLSAEEPGFAVGRVAVHRVMTYAPMTTFTRATEAHGGALTAWLYAVSRTEGRVWFVDPAVTDMMNAMAQMILWIILGGSLLLAVGVGISSAMESMLARKTEEIGMLRAVGATRRQIRRLFGRDAWLLTALALPGGMLLGAATAWLIARMAPEEMVFSPSPGLLLPVAALAAGCIFLSSRLPLRRAARQMPLGVLRDTGMLRRAKRFRSRKQFWATALIAARQARLHPFRQAGGAVMVMLMLMCSAMLCELGYSALESGASTASYDFRMEDPMLRSSTMEFAEVRDTAALTEQDVAQVRAIPQVKEVRATRYAQVNLVLEGEVPAYFRDYYAMDASQWVRAVQGMAPGERYMQYFNISNRSESMAYLQMDEWDEADLQSLREGGMADYAMLSAYYTFRQMEMVREALGIAGKLVNIPIYAVDVEDEAFQQAVREVRIDRARLDAGQEVLVYAPAQYVYPLDEKGIRVSTTEVDGLGPWVASLESDYFHAGQALCLMQLVEEPAESHQGLEEETFRQALEGMTRADAQVRVGAVLTGECPLEESWSWNTLALYTTVQGAQQLGLYLHGPQSVSITLAGDVDAETEAAIARRLEQIAMRGADMTVFNRLAYTRQTRQRQRQVAALFVGITVLFFAVSVAMQVGNAGRRIRADSRMIGTLRAVGADERALMRCYRLPVLMAAAAGFLLAMAAYAIICRYWNTAFLQYHPWVIVPVLGALAALCALCCLAGVRVRLRQVIKRSIVENIKEL